MEAQEIATGIVKRLVSKGFTAYFAGGWVRDFVMGHPSSDVDIATSAPPEKILDLFENTIEVGIAFGTVIIVLDGHQFEVSTFRRDIDYEGGRRPTRIELTEAKEDAKRRDFTINGLFYDPLEEKIHDYVQGLEDIEKGIVRTIGNAHERFEEDRLRMIRAVRFASRFEFHLDLETQEAIQQYADTLFPPVAVERVWQEFNKMAEFPHFDVALVEMHRLGLLPVIFPTLTGVHLNEMKKRVRHFSDFPPGCPTLLFLMDLFPGAHLLELIEICQYLKLSNRNQQLLEFAFQSRLLLEEAEPNDLALVHFYAHPQSELYLQVYAAHLHEREVFLAKHRKKRAALLPHIERNQQKRPLVTSALLMKSGIEPGERMGALLHEAECLAIEKGLDDPLKVLALLKESPNWKE